MAVVRIFLATYRRPTLLRRALQSLLSQTFGDWTCELHNDAPDDDEPRAVLDDLAPGDSRFSYQKHSFTWGAVAVFNHAFRGGAEPYASLLEDDNWWEPSFLETAQQALEASPGGSLAWANMRMWREEPDGSWSNLGQNIWTGEPLPAGIVKFDRPELLQAFDSLHSQGAMVFRPRQFRVPSVPATTPLAIIEPLRERAALGPLLFIPRPLANFACTVSTARGSDPVLWLQSKLLVAASFLRPAEIDAVGLRRIWAARRAQRPRDTGIFFLLAISLGRFQLIRDASFGDWLHFLLSTARHPCRTARGLRFRRDEPETWSWLIAQTEAGGRRSVCASVVSKHMPSDGLPIS